MCASVVSVCMCARVHVCVCVCVREKKNERERERERKKERERERARARERVRGRESQREGIFALVVRRANMYSILASIEYIHFHGNSLSLTHTNIHT